MLRSERFARIWTGVRAVIALAILAAVVGQLARTIGLSIGLGRDVPTVIVNYFSFFTIISNNASIVVLAWAVVWFVRRGRRADAEPFSLAVALACVTTYMLVTGLVYNTLLRGIDLEAGATVWWSNEILHVVAPLFFLADLFLGPRRRALPWRAVLIVLVFPIVWVVYTLVRGPFVSAPASDNPYWYPYPFLDPNLQPGGYLGVAGYVVAIALAIAGFAMLVVATGRWRNTPKQAALPEQG